MIYAGYSKSERTARAAEVLEQVNLGDRMDHQPNQLSGGQRQRHCQSLSEQTFYYSQMNLQET
jgi:ABC-type methionine transport system ATPase subunit